MSDIAKKLRESRRIEIKVGDITFLATRATSEQFFTYANEKISDAQVCRNHVYGWSGVKESDLIPDGNQKEVSFDKDLFDEVISENPDWWSEIAKQIIQSTADRLKARETNQKK